MQYRKKPITVNALKWDGKRHRNMFDFLTDSKYADENLKTFTEDFYIDFSRGEGGLVIKTSEGDMFATIGDYIIKEPFDKDRKYYPCKPDIFELTYEKIINKTLT